VLPSHCAVKHRTPKSQDRPFMRPPSSRRAGCGLVIVKPILGETPASDVTDVHRAVGTIRDAFGTASVLRHDLQRRPRDARGSTPCAGRARASSVDVVPSTIGLRKKKARSDKSCLRGFHESIRAPAVGVRVGSEQSCEVPNRSRSDRRVPACCTICENEEIIAIGCSCGRAQVRHASRVNRVCKHLADHRARRAARRTARCRGLSVSTPLQHSSSEAPQREHMAGRRRSPGREAGSRAPPNREAAVGPHRLPCPQSGVSMGPQNGVSFRARRSGTIGPIRARRGRVALDTACRRDREPRQMKLIDSGDHLGGMVRSPSFSPVSSSATSTISRRGRASASSIEGHGHEVPFDTDCDAGTLRARVGWRVGPAGERDGPCGTVGSRRLRTDLTAGGRRIRMASPRPARPAGRPRAVGR